MHATPVQAPPFPARVPDGTRVYAVGDIHGRLDLLDVLLARMASDCARDRPARVVVVFLGDYVDRGPDSRQVVERLLQGPPAGTALAGAQWVCLRGNHEEYMVRFADSVGAGAAWCRNGGIDTVRSYVGDLPEGVTHDMPGMQALLARALPPAHLRFLARLPLIHREGDYVFVHAGLRPGVALEDQDAADMLWIRDDFLFAPPWAPVVVVHGHTPSPTPDIRPHRIGIDTGAYYSGVLTALVLEGADRRFLIT